MEIRQTWNEYFMELAEKLATRSTCDRANVGAVIVNADNRIVSTGYNGNLKNNNHCNDVGHTMIDGHCVSTLHAEMNAILYSASEGVRLKDTKIYVTHFPCINCTKSIIAAGIKKVIYKNDYRVDDFSLELFKTNNVELEKF